MPPDHPSSTASLLVNAFATGTAAVDAHAATLNHITAHNNTLALTDHKKTTSTIDLTPFHDILIVGAGKAVAGCVDALTDHVFKQYTDTGILHGTVITKHGFNTSKSTQAFVNIVEAAHPVPDTDTFGHTDHILALLRTVTPQTLVVFVLTGGASSLFELPVPDVPQSDLITFYRIMQRCGADIVEINTLRQQVSAVKGGKLLSYIHSNATVVTLAISDVIGDDPSIIGSGPTYIDANAADRLTIDELLHKYKLTDGSNKLPDSVLQVLHDVKNNIPTAARNSTYYTLIANNYVALSAACKFIHQQLQSQKAALIITDRLHGDVSTATDIVMSIIESCIANNEPAKPPCSLIFGGETTVQFNSSTADAQGGRNQHMAMLLARRLRRLQNVTVLCASTDGNDHVENIAGAVVDCHTYNAALQHGIDVEQYIRRFDSYHFFSEYDRLTGGDAHINVGMTNTNVADMILVYIDATV